MQETVAVAGWVVLVPLGLLIGGVALQMLLAGVLSPRAKGWLALIAGLGTLAGVAGTWPLILAGHAVDKSFGSWDGPVRLCYHVDGLAFFFALMAAGIGASVLLYSVCYMEREKGTTRFYALLLLFIAGLIHLVYTADLLLLYFSWEIVGLCSFFLVGFWYRLPEAAYGARKVLTVTHLAGYGLLVAVVLLYVRTGSTLWTDSAVQSAFTSGIFLLVFISALAKSVQFPFHTWIPDAMAAPTPVSALLHAACYVKAGVYLAARMHSLGTWPTSWGFTVSWLGASTLLLGALFMLAQRDLKRLLAFSTVSQIGYMMVGLGLGTPLGIAAALFHCLNHGLFKGGLFLCAGAVQHACGTRDMDCMGGLGRRMPRTFQLWLICAGGVAGVPLLNGFASKWMLFNAALEANQPLLLFVLWAGSILTVFAFLKATSGVFLGNDGSAVEHAHEVSRTMLGGGGVLAAGCVLLGVAPQLGIAYLINPLLPAVGAAPLNGVTWFGLSTGQGTWFAIGGLTLAMVALIVGGLIYLLHLPARGEAAMAGGAPSVFTGGEPPSPQGRLGASDFSQIIKQGLGPFYRAFDIDQVWLSLWRALGTFASRLAALLKVTECSPVLYLLTFSMVMAVLASFVPVAETTAKQAASEAFQPWVMLAVGVGVSSIGLLLATAAVPKQRRLAGLLAVVAVLTCGSMMVRAALPRTLLLEAAAASALVVLWRTSDRASARRAYLVTVSLSAFGMVGGMLAAEHGNGHLALALLLPAITVKLGLIPLWFWLPLIVESTPAVVTGIVIGVVDVAVFAEVLTLRTAEPWLFGFASPWLAIAAASAVGGALLALAQRDLKRLLAFSTIADMGLLVAALALGGEYGLLGAALGATVHALAKALLFASLAGHEADGMPLVDARGLASRYPIAATGFIVGALSVMGVPLTLGYAAHWRIFVAVAAAGKTWLLVALASAAMLNVAIYARAIALFWWGAELSPGSPRAYSRPMLAAALIILGLALLATGMWPQLLKGMV
jgi:multicomponent Na+:H+ antiporter subunit A